MSLVTTEVNPVLIYPTRYSRGSSFSPYSYGVYAVYPITSCGTYVLHQSCDVGSTSCSGTAVLTFSPVPVPTIRPTQRPTQVPSPRPSTTRPSHYPSIQPTKRPTQSPTLITGTLAFNVTFTISGYNVSTSSNVVLTLTERQALELAVEHAFALDSTDVTLRRAFMINTQNRRQLADSTEASDEVQDLSIETYDSSHKENHRILSQGPVLQIFTLRQLTTIFNVTVKSSDFLTSASFESIAEDLQAKINASISSGSLTALLRNYGAQTGLEDATVISAIFSALTVEVVETPKENAQSSLSAGEIAGIVIGTFYGFALIVAVVVFKMLLLLLLLLPLLLLVHMLKMLILSMLLKTNPVLRNKLSKQKPQYSQ